MDKISMKTYECTQCGHEIEAETNHYGAIYPSCSVCGQVTIYKCTTEAPAGAWIPPIWEDGDIERIRKFQANISENISKAIDSIDKEREEFASQHPELKGSNLEEAFLRHTLGDEEFEKIQQEAEDDALEIETDLLLQKLFGRKPEKDEQHGEDGDPQTTD